MNCEPGPAGRGLQTHECTTLSSQLKYINKNTDDCKRMSVRYMSPIYLVQQVGERVQKMCEPTIK